MLLELVISIIILIMIFAGLKYLWQWLKWPDDLLKVILFIIGGLFLIKVLRLIWPLIYA